MNKEKDKKYFVKSKSEKETDGKDNDTQSFKSSIKLNEKRKTTNVCKKNWIAQQSSKTTKKQKFVASLLLCHILLQFFLPYSHFISKVPPTNIRYYYITLIENLVIKYLLNTK